MIEERINILSDKAMRNADAICFTSNGVIKKNNELVMGAGIAKAFKNKFEDLPQIAGILVKLNGNICQKIDKHIDMIIGQVNIVSFPTKHHWRDKSDINLIKKSAKELMALIEENNWKMIYLTRPGCGMGGLSWKEVKLAIENILDDRVVIAYL